MELQNTPLNTNQSQGLPNSQAAVALMSHCLCQKWCQGREKAGAHMAWGTYTVEYKLQEYINTNSLKHVFGLIAQSI